MAIDVWVMVRVGGTPLAEANSEPPDALATPPEEPEAELDAVAPGRLPNEASSVHVPASFGGSWAAGRAMSTTRAERKRQDETIRRWVR
jgi:hypothetical protein